LIAHLNQINKYVCMYVYLNKLFNPSKKKKFIQIIHSLNRDYHDNQNSSNLY